MRTLVVLPAHNEARSLPGVLLELRSTIPKVDCLVVDDASSDDTTRVMDASAVASLRLCVRLGVGGAMRAGFRYARARGYDRVARFDADGQHRASDLAALLAPLSLGADAVIGSRYHGQGGWRPHARLRVLQRMLAWLVSAVGQTRITDPTSGLAAFGPRAVALLAERHPTGYSEPELILLLRRHGLRVVEVPVVMRPRSYGRSSLTPARIALALWRVLFAIALVPLRAADRPRP